MSRSLLVRSSFLFVLALAACGDDSGTATLTPPTERGVASSGIQPVVENDPLKVSIHKLENGLTVMLSENHETPRIYAMITTRAGSAKDPADATGMAHYLEHMLFKGTTKLGTTDWEKEKPHIEAITRLYDERFATTDDAKRADLYRQIDEENKLAAKYACANELDQLYDLWGFQRLNAFTNQDQTLYVGDIPSNRLEHWARIEVERYTDPVFRLFQSELEAVYEESNQGMDDERRSLYKAAMLAALPDHPYGTQSTIGKIEHLKNPSLTKMRAYFDKWYVPGNMVVALAGDFDSKEALAIVEEHLGRLPAKPVPPDPVRSVTPPQGVKRVEFTHKGDPQVMLIWHTVPVGHADRDALVLCDMMLDNQQTGLINVNLNQAQRVRGAGSSPQFMIEAGLQRLFAIPKGDQTLEECEALLHEQIAKLKAGEFTAEDLKAVITDFEVSQKRQREENQTRASTMTSSYVERVAWPDRVAELDRLRKITREQVIAAATEYFGDNYIVVSKTSGTPEFPKVEKPNFTPVSIEEQHSAFFDEMAALPSEPIPPKFAKKGEDYTVKDYPWGRLYWVENPANDLFSISFNFEIGTDHDKDLELGLPLLDLGGAGDLDPVAYKRKLYSLGTTASAGAGTTETVVTIEGLDANFESSVALVQTHFAKPTGVGQEQLSQMVEQEVTRRGFNKKDPRWINSALVNFAMRGIFSPFIDTTTNEDLLEAKAEDVLGAARSLWGHKRIVTYTGPRSVDEVAAAIAPANAEPGLADAPPRDPVMYIAAGRNRVLYVNAPGAQARVALLSPDGFFDPQAYPAARVYNEYMSGSMGSVVFQEVRESRSLAYSAWTQYRTPNYRGDQNMMMGSLTCQTDKTVEAVEVLLGLIRKMPAEEERIDRVRKAVDQVYRTSRMTFRRLPSAALTWDRWGVGKDPREYNWETASKMSLADLERFATRFEDVPFTVAITGDVSRIDMDALKKFGDLREMQPDDLFAW